MRYVGLFVFTILLFILPQQTATAKQASTVPTAWLDSLNANSWRMDVDSLGYSFQVLTLQHRLDKKGNTKQTDTLRVVRTFNDQGQRLVEELDAAGEVKSSRIEEKEKDREKTDETTDVKEEENSDGQRRVNLSMNPFSSFNPENRDSFTFTLLSPDPEGHPRFKIDPVGDKPGFLGEFTIDTTLWIPLHITGHPSEPPKHVNTFEMDMTFAPDANGACLIRQAESHVEASFLLLKFYMLVEQEFSDYQKMR